MKEYLDPKHAALIVVGLQNDFFHKQGNAVKGEDPAAILSRQAIVPKIEQLIYRARAQGIPVIFTRMTIDRKTLSEPMRVKGEGLKNARKGTWGSEYFRLSPQEGDLEVENHRYSAFVGTNLDLILRSLNCKSVLLAGVRTDICVDCTAKEAFMKDYHVAIVGDCCSGSSPEAHEAALQQFDRYFGMVTDSNGLFAYWEQEAAAKTVTA